MREQTGPMACPVDGATLVMSERQGIEIDYCPQCRGVWLDRGELDKIIERGSAAAPTPPAPPAAPVPPSAPQPPQYQERYQERGYGHQPHGHHHKRRKSFLEELFD